MKKLFLVAFLTVAVAASSFAKDTKKVNAMAMNSFKTEFAKATNIAWTSTENYYKATFVLDNEKMEAFYSETGEKVGTSKSITVNELPVKAKRAFAKDYSGYTVKEVIEFDGIEEAGYYISAENEKDSIILKVNNLGGLSTYKTTKK